VLHIVLVCMCICNYACMIVSISLSSIFFVFIVPVQPSLSNSANVQGYSIQLSEQLPPSSGKLYVLTTSFFLFIIYSKHHLSTAD